MVELKRNLTLCQGSVKDLSDSLAECANLKADISHSYETLSQSHEAVSRNLGSCEFEASNLTAQKQSIQQDLADERSKSGHQGLQMVSLQEQNAKCQETLRNCTGESHMLRDRSARAEADVRKNTRQINSLEADNTDLTSQLSEAV